MLGGLALKRRWQDKMKAAGNSIKEPGPNKLFELHYLGRVEYSFNLNFSRPAAPVLAQYFSFISLGF
ncbi:hypothetical protein CF326_g9858 [Tilletia indica]|nr:hypothetical protein CF326_g9858 [Tilletia indica]